MIKRFEDLVIWQMAREIVSDIYRVLEKNRDFDFKSQIQRAAISVMNNIAEGFDRNKHKEQDDNNQFVYFLNVALGSCGEVKSMLYVADDLKYIETETIKTIQDKCYGLSQKILAFIKYLQEKQKTKNNVQSANNVREAHPTTK